MFTSPRVELIAHTSIVPAAIDHYMPIQDSSTPAETLTTFAGRACYQSFDRPNPNTKEDADYLKRTLFEQNHWSIAEHATASIYITGVSRALTHELIRHRHLSYSQLSQRFVDEKDANFVCPPAIVNMADERHFLDTSGTASALDYEELVHRLTDAGLPRKQAREAARAALPNMTETRIVVTGNLRAWHEVIQRRTKPDADAEMQYVMRMVNNALHTIAPAIFDRM